ncbi:4'-phosphopantetheinyl transferase [Mucilaginibacter gracilis]|uniref:4'-phosphopantetheinyl transferase n=1 Tax=Mucilaginibacter gracilis TaxID=423350 RepID=A0A495IX04_9SPHI|nr:4'-phosphopantetheinyl transferase superfamily protein [Mucilaginibacter gracilis]RKR81215.1 4'-phosphopantetheinyl transferase [Mucilaginibacter gracilis]
MGTTTILIEDIENIEWVNADNNTFNLTTYNDVWRIFISSVISQMERFWSLLSAHERERANRYYREADKQRFIISRAVLRVLLGKYLNADPSLLSFKEGPNKKPYLNGNATIHFNVSHSDDCILVAISETEIGVDVEQLDVNVHYTDIMDISFGPAEIAHVKQSAMPLHSFYTLWTRKEALLKATAKGIDDDIKQVPGLTGLHFVDNKIIGSANTSLVKSFNAGDTYMGSVAIVTKNCRFLNHSKGFLF